MGVLDMYCKYLLISCFPLSYRQTLFLEIYFSLLIRQQPGNGVRGYAPYRAKEQKGLLLTEDGLRRIDQVELVQAVVGKVVEGILVVGAVGVVDPTSVLSNMFLTEQDNDMFRTSPISVLSNMFLTYQDNGRFRTPFVRGD